MMSSVSLFVEPVAIQPGKSGEYAEYPVSVFSMMMRYCNNYNEFFLNRIDNIEWKFVKSTFSHIVVYTNPSRRMANNSVNCMSK